MEDCDYLVVGGGPAGSAVATYLSKADKKIILLERGRYDREKVCGDGLTLDAQYNLEDLGVLSDIEKKAIEINKLGIHFGSLNFKINTKFMTLKRNELDQILRNNALNCGAKVYHGCRVESIVNFPDHIEAYDKENRKYKAKAALIATGSNLKLPRKLGFSVPEKLIANGIRGYMKNKNELDSYEVFILKSGYGWLFPAPDNLVNVGVGTFKGDSYKNLRILLDEFLQTAKDYTDSKELTVIRGSPVNTGLLDYQKSLERMLLIGDSASCALDFYAKGIGEAIQSARIATDVILKAENSNNFNIEILKYTQRLNEEMKIKHKAYSYLQNLQDFPGLMQGLVFLISKSKKFQSRFKDLIEDTIKPDNLFSLRGLIETFVR